MANIPIWPGSSSFFPGDTPFGFYDNDPQFQSDAEKVATWCAQRLGYPLVDIELQSINFFTCFEEAINEYGAQLYNFQIISNFHTLNGATTGSNLNNSVIATSLGSTVNIASQYGSWTNLAGGNYSGSRGSIEVRPGQSRYDLLRAASSSISGSDDVYVMRVYHDAPPAISRYFDPYAGTGTGIQSLMQSFGFGNYSPGVNFMLMPIYYDILKIQAIEFNDQIRKSAYSFDVKDNQYLELFPIPTGHYRLWFDYVLRSEINNPTQLSGTGNPQTGLITNVSNVPYTTPIYLQINEPGRQWIRRYALALAKEMLCSVRGKYGSIPIPGAETTLDHVRLCSEAKDEKTKLIEEFTNLLEETTRLKQLERQNAEGQQIQEAFAKVPYPIYVM